MQLSDPIEVTGFSQQWLTRNSPLLRNYICHLFPLLTFISLTLVIILNISVFRFKRAVKRDRADKTNHAADLRPKVEERFRKTCRGNFYISLVSMIHVVVIAMVDGFICVILLSNEASSGSWDINFVFQLIGFSLFLGVLFTLAFVVVPMLQMVLATYLLARFVRKDQSKSLNDYVPEARLITTHVAQFWTFACLLLTVFWMPTYYTTVRFVALQAAWGSAIAWMDAAFAFNFCAEKLADKDLNLSTNGVREIVAMFGETVKAVHGKGGEKDILPRYEEVAQEEH